MGLPGRKPKPPTILRLEGNPGHKQIKDTIKINTSMPECPEWLDDIAKQEWDRIAPDLYEAGILENQDSQVLAIYCNAISEIIICTQAIGEEGGLKEYLKGKNSQTTPLITTRNKAIQTAKSFCTEFGLTPSARCRIEIPGKTDKNDEDDFD